MSVVRFELNVFIGFSFWFPLAIHVVMVWILAGLCGHADPPFLFTAEAVHSDSLRVS